MSRWPEVDLGDLATCLDSRRVPIKEDERPSNGTVPYYGANGQVGWMNTLLFDEPLLLIAEDGGFFDQPEKGVAYLISGPSWVNNHAHVLRPNPSKVRLEFLGYFFRHFNFLPYITGTTRSKLTQKDLFKVKVPLPSLPEQERIVRILNEADQLRRLRADADRRITNLIPALFDDLFNEKKATIGKWPVGSLRSFGVAVRYGLGQPPEEDADGVPLIRATNIKCGSIVPQGLIRVKKDEVPTGRNPFLKVGEVLVVRSGAYTGDVGRVSAEWADAVAGYDLVLTPSERVDSHFLTWFLLSPTIQNNYFANEKNRAAQPHLNATQVESTPCILPPLTLQREFSLYVEEARTLQLQQASNRQRLDDLFQSLLHRAFQGEL